MVPKMTWTSFLSIFVFYVELSLTIASTSKSRDEWLQEWPQLSTLKVVYILLIAFMITLCLWLWCIFAFDPNLTNNDDDGSRSGGDKKRAIVRRPKCYVIRPDGSVVPTVEAPQSRRATKKIKAKHSGHSKLNTYKKSMTMRKRKQENNRHISSPKRKRSSKL